MNNYEGFICGAPFAIGICVMIFTKESGPITFYSITEQEETGQKIYEIVKEDFIWTHIFLFDNGKLIKEETKGE